MILLRIAKQWLRISSVPTGYVNRLTVTQCNAPSFSTKTLSASTHSWWVIVAIMYLGLLLVKALPRPKVLWTWGASSNRCSGLTTESRSIGPGLSIWKEMTSIRESIQSFSESSSVWLSVSWPTYSNGGRCALPVPQLVAYWYCSLVVIVTDRPTKEGGREVTGRLRRVRVYLVFF
jgi:hypothetical protein